MASTVLKEGSAPPRGKRGFANRARRFANPAARLARLPGFPMLWISMAAAAVLTTVTGAFNTGVMPVGLRALFWSLILGWNLVKWQTWFAFTVRKPADWTRASLVGGLLLNLTLPVETILCLRLIGVDATTSFAGTWLYAFIISLALFAIIWAAKSRMRRPVLAVPATAVEDGLLARAGVASDALAAIRAEDHYCRVHRRDGSSALVHYRFADALAETGGLDGAQVHRGIWVAADALRGAVRERRRWRLLLAGGGSVPVSASRVAEARRRGWLRRAPPTVSER